MTGVFETIRVRLGTMPLLDRHLKRFRQNSVVALETDLPGDTVDRIGRVASDGAPENVIRVEWDGRDLNFTTRDVPRINPLSLITSSVVHPGYAVKTTDRAAFDSARREAARAGADEALLLTGDGCVAEGTIFAVGWFAGDELSLPALDLEILPSIGRQRVVEVARQLGITIREGRFGLEEISGRPLFVMTSVRGVVRAASLDGQPVPADARVNALSDAFWPQT